MEKGYVALVLHAHLPYVRHPEHDDFLEEDWLYEAITETYIPLIEVFNQLIDEGVDFRITMSLTPTLISMLTDPLLQTRYVKHIEKLIELADKEVTRTRWQPELNKLALMYYHQFVRSRSIFVDRYTMNLVTAFKEIQEAGRLEIITCCATHGFLPLMEHYRRAAVKAQVHVGVETHRRHLGVSPAGIWLPECGYFPGDDAILREEGIRFFMVDTHGVLFGSPRPKNGVYAPCYCKGSGVAAFARDMESSKSVWSAEEGYPGDHVYRDFYRDIGFDLDFDYIKPYINPDGIRINTGIKYHRITGRTMNKAVYDADIARSRAAEHAGNFMFNRQKQVEHLYDIMGQKPLIVSPYDAELFGHWWFEGPQWLYYFLKKTYYDQKTVKLLTPSDYLKRHPTNQVITPSLSSWGHKGYCEVWLEGSNDWIYRHLHKAVERMVDSAHAHPQAEGVKRRALNQMARELLLLQSSDWAFIMKTDTCVPYAQKRTREHLSRFTRLYESVQSGQIDEHWLIDIEGKDNLFPHIDYKIYLS